jgi:hypothetical protein
VQSFDELLLLKRGGRVIFFGSLGERSQDLVDYLQVRARAAAAVVQGLLMSMTALHVNHSIFSMSAEHVVAVDLLQDIEGVPKIEEGINPATYALQVPTARCCSRHSGLMQSATCRCVCQPNAPLVRNLVCWQVTNRSKEKDLDKDFADVYEQSDLHKCAMHRATMRCALYCSSCTVLLLACCNPCSTSGQGRKVVRHLAASFAPSKSCNVVV